METKEEKKCFKCQEDLEETGIMFQDGSKEYHCRECNISQP
ncbi:MAG: hypothetical protein WC788_03835 [Candidatus Paceibacterota bacterium]